MSRHSLTSESRLKTLHIPRHLSHVLMHGMVLCIICQHACFRGVKCPCCREKEPLYREAA